MTSDPPDPAPPPEEAGVRAESSYGGPAPVSPRISSQGSVDVVRGGPCEQPAEPQPACPGRCSAVSTSIAKSFSKPGVRGSDQRPPASSDERQWGIPLRALSTGRGASGGSLRRVPRSAIAGSVRSPTLARHRYRGGGPRRIVSMRRCAVSSPSIRGSIGGVSRPVGACSFGVLHRGHGADPEGSSQHLRRCCADELLPSRVAGRADRDAGGAEGVEHRLGVEVLPDRCRGTTIGSSRSRRSACWLGCRDGVETLRRRVRGPRSIRRSVAVERSAPRCARRRS